MRENNENFIVKILEAQFISDNNKITDYSLLLNKTLFVNYEVLKHSINKEQQKTEKLLNEIELMKISLTKLEKVY